MTNNELIKIAEAAGFEKSNGTGFCGNSDLDELLYVGEYAIGEQLLKFAEIVESKLVPEGYVIIPIEPTDEMIAVYENRKDIYETPQALHKALLLAVYKELKNDAK